MFAVVFFTFSKSHAQSSTGCVKYAACFEFTFVSATPVSNNNVQLRFKIKTNCNRSLSNAAFGLPAGQIASQPFGSYAAAYNYSVENPTNNPFYSIKFEALNANSYKNGVSDIFEYVISSASYASLTSFKVQAKAGNTTGTVTFKLSDCNPIVECTSPTVQASGPATVCTGSAVAYTATVNGSAASLVWTVPSGWSIVSGQGTASISVMPGTSAGSVSVVASNNCGSRSSSVTVVAQDCQTTSGSCVKTDACFVFNYMGATFINANQVKLAFTVTTNCQNSLSNVAFGLPAGATPFQPVNNYNGNYNYTVENTTYNPFYSIKFNAQNASTYSNGASDAFSYVISATDYANMTTIQVQAKAANTIGNVTFNLADCNPTFNCPRPQVVVNGPDTACYAAFQDLTYSATLLSGTTSGYTWEVPSDWMIIDGQGTPNLTVIAGLISGNVSVTVSNICGATTRSMFVTVTPECGDVVEPLPVTFASFSAERNNREVELAWETASEHNNKAFFIERSANGKEFEEIGTVAGRGTTDYASQYSFTDVAPLSGISYYRLRQVDFDGTIAYSPVKAVNADNAIAAISAYPNPTQGKLSIELPAETIGTTTISITSATGKVMFTETTTSLSGVYQTDLSRLMPGMYILTVSNSAGNQSLRITKQ